MILKKDSGDEQKFCMTLMEKTVGGIGILNSDLFSDQFFLQCISIKKTWHKHSAYWKDMYNFNFTNLTENVLSVHYPKMLNV
jgi:hypothetical protein